MLTLPGSIETIIFSSFGNVEEFEEEDEDEEEDEEFYLFLYS